MNGGTLFGGFTPTSEVSLDDVSSAPLPGPGTLTGSPSEPEEPLVEAHPIEDTPPLGAKVFPHNLPQHGFGNPLDKSQVHIKDAS